ncbi:tetratricopeptide repeat protein [candidate division KSB1 bacterium]|nr:tetratricopeptide repeat protein [candidate division KSB1 bacterium]
MKFPVLLTAFVLIISLQGCAYFNTYYNTKKLYKEALDERKRRPTTTPDKPTSAEIQKLDKTIEKGSKILQLHPNSKYVDDTLLMLGECFFQKQEYPQALRKFNELTSIFPKSDLVPAALLWKARTYIEQEDFTNAEAVLKDLQNRKKSGDILYQAQYYLAEIYYRQEQYDPAARLFEPAAKKMSDKKLRTEAYLRWGECRFKLKQYHEAAKAYYQASKQDVEIDIKFNAGLSFARALKADSSYHKALIKLNSMQKEFSNHKDLSWVRFEIADCKLRQGKREEAEDLFAAINANDKRTEASAAAFFVMGDLYQRTKYDYAKAKEAFDKVRSENNRSAYAEEAQRRAKAIDDYQKLKNAISLLEMQQNSPGDEAKLAAAMEQKGKSTRASIRRLPSKKLDLSNDPAKLRNDLADQWINLAELYYYQFEQPDSAIYMYQNVIRDFGDTEAAPAAMYALAFLRPSQDSTSTAERDSLLQLLATKYSNTRHGREARKRLGFTDAGEPQAATASEKFRRAEDLLLTNENPQEAIRLLQDLSQTQNDPEMASKSLFAIGWIYENKLTDNTQAYATYKQLLEKFPTSAYSNKVRKKVSAFEKQTAAAAADSSTVQQKASEDLRTRIEQDRQNAPAPIEKTSVQDEKPPAQQDNAEKVDDVSQDDDDDDVPPPR